MQPEILSRISKPLKDVRGPHGYMGHYDELVALCKAIRHDTEPPMTVEEGRHVLQVEKAIFESITTGQVIDHATFLARWDTTQPASQGKR